MTVETTHLLVSPYKRERRATMLKLPCRPFARVMTPIALRLEHTFVYISHLVALLTAIAFGAKPLRGMTRVTRQQLVHAGNGKSGEIVAECCGRPAGTNRVTIRAGLAEAPLVNVIAAVAVQASRTRMSAVDLLARRMACNARHRLVAALEGKRC